MSTKRFRPRLPPSRAGAYMAAPILALVLAIMGGASSAAERIEKRSARSLVQACEVEQAAATSWCAAYLMGVADTFTVFGEGGHKGGLWDTSYAIEDLGDVFLIWMQKSPRFLDLDMLAGASLALRQRWPCR